MVKAVAESIMREVVGLKTIDGILTTDRASVEADVQKRMQDLPNTYRAGVLVKKVQLQSVDAPSEVLFAYRDVTAAQQDQAARRQRSGDLRQQGRAGGRGWGCPHRCRGQAPIASSRDDPRGEGPGPPAILRSTTNTKKAPGVTRERMYPRDDGARASSGRWTRRLSI